MRYVSSLLALIAVLLLQAPAARAVPLTFNAILTGAAEIPPNNSPATGLAKAVLDESAHTLALHIEFSELTSATTASHIHCCVPAAGGNLMVATTTPTFVGFPLGVTSGIYDTVLDLTQASSYRPGFITAEGGIAEAEAALIAALKSGANYLNIHTTGFPGGEIRGALVPEPASALLLGSALAGLGLIGYRRARRRDIATPL